MDCRWPLCCGADLLAPVGGVLLLQELLPVGGSACTTSGARISAVTNFCAVDVRALVILLDLLRQESSPRPGTLVEFEQLLTQYRHSIRQRIAEILASRNEFIFRATKSFSRLRFSKRRSFWGRKRADFFPDLSRKQAKRLIKKLVKRSLWKDLGQVKLEKTMNFPGVWLSTSTALPPVETEVAFPGESTESKDFAGDASIHQSLHDQKLQALRGLAYGASHEINNPLANIAMRAEALARSESDEKRRTKLWVIHQQALRAHQMISDLMLFANPPRSEPEEVDIPELLREIVAEYRMQISAAQIEIHVTAHSLPSTMFFDRRQISEMVKALLDNSIQAIGSGGEISISARMDSRGAVAIEVDDTGAGIPANIQSKIFDPFFSGREAGRGLGFGLSKAWRIAQEHGGDLVCLSGEVGATRFLATLCDLRGCQTRVA